MGQRSIDVIVACESSKLAESERNRHAAPFRLITPRAEGVASEAAVVSLQPRHEAPVSKMSHSSSS